MPSSRSGASFNPSRSSQKGYGCDFGRRKLVTDGQGRNIKSQSEGLKQCIAAQRVPDPCRPVEKLHELLPDCEKIPGPYQHLQAIEWMESIDKKEKYDSFDRRMKEKQPSTTQTAENASPSSQQQQFQCDKAAPS
ncbi:hypothetical protein O181_029724 [Austropuccinia psidii MF-1]|uniref:Uncharacterized protein n=1 Tax=Austropuccinia psidii MF-1 TaxID=1389203 RepID=A0A9Q3CSS8_9BASI|nr:hypothetical protein [Austropuccinia psidii MF-1]